jgi:CoA:oxalate CoA-transferase
VLDLKHPEAITLVRRLVTEADVLLENFRPGVMQRLGLGCDTLRALNPRLVYCSISGYGQTGAAAERAAYAMIVQAASGYERTLARYAGDRTRPAATATFVADLLGGLYAFSAIQTALLQRERTGVGQQLDVALMDSMLNLLVYELQEAQGQAPLPRPTYGPVAAADGDVLIVPITTRNFDALREVTQLPELFADPRFTTPSARATHWAAMMEVVERWTRDHPATEVLRRLEAAGVPCARYNEPADALNDPVLVERGAFSRVEDAAGAFLGVNAPWRMSGSATSIGGAGAGRRRTLGAGAGRGAGPGRRRDRVAAGCRRVRPVDRWHSAAFEITRLERAAGRRAQPQSVLQVGLEPAGFAVDGLQRRLEKVFLHAPQRIHGLGRQLRRRRRRASVQRIGQQVVLHHHLARHAQASRIRAAATPVRSLPAVQWKTSGASPCSSCSNNSAKRCDCSPTTSER